ncbi:hypothetical protein E3U43_008632 [Larimichthys crocea]|uniref:Uncharacterized protein n=1 Tax=Larimichthys crocea TaxID=215358 RepID=A0ACD3RWI6_LARCR|nr:hypothetical protein E3U43_008632 [Larimichthys crocea]
MAARPFWHLSSRLTWIFVFSFPSTGSEMDAPKLFLESSVFVAFADKGLDIQCGLEIPANYSQDVLRCYDPSHREIYKCDTPSTGNEVKPLWPVLELRNLTSSGEYFCQYKTVRVYWFLRVTHHDYKDVGVLDYMDIPVSVLTIVLLVFSVVGSVYVFRGNWNESTSDPGNTNRKRKNNRQERKESEAKEDNVNVIAPSFYASLEPRPRSIYDVLDRSAVTTEPPQSKAKPKKKEPQKTTVQTSQPEQEGVFESIYENF